MVLLHIITLVIPNFRLFRSISYRFQKKFGQIFKNWSCLANILVAISKILSIRCVHIPNNVFTLQNKIMSGLAGNENTL